jgi:chromosome partitioning protein
VNVITFASRKGGSGKSTLVAHLASLAERPGHHVLVIDADPQGSLKVWDELREAEVPVIVVAGSRSVGDAVKQARKDGYEWVFIDTPPNNSTPVVDAIKAATLVVVPTRPAVFDLAAVKDTIELARGAKKPYAVVINSAPPKREDVEAPAVVSARESLKEVKAPVWSGQITSRSALSLALAEGEGAREYQASSLAAQEIAKLWQALQRSVRAIHEG